MRCVFDRIINIYTCIYTCIYVYTYIMSRWAKYEHLCSAKMVHLWQALQEATNAEGGPDFLPGQGVILQLGTVQTPNNRN